MIWNFIGGAGCGFFIWVAFNFQEVMANGQHNLSPSGRLVDSFIAFLLIGGLFNAFVMGGDD
jgi:hypothetical protein